jgi:hypothetical protein
MGWLFLLLYVGCHVGAIYKRGQPLKKENNNLKRKTTTNPNVCIKDIWLHPRKQQKGCGEKK